MVGLLLGAGFSKWAAGLPVASELFDFQMELDTRDEERKSQILKSFKEGWDKEKQHRANAEQFIEYVFSSANKNEIVTNALVWYLQRRLVDNCIWKEGGYQRRINRRVLMFDEERKFQVSGIQTARQFILNSNPRGNGIITTNYDTLIEYALGTKLFNYGKYGEPLKGRGPYPAANSNKNPVKLGGNISIAKVHGSLSWDEYGTKYTDCKLTITRRKPLIVPPTQYKKPPDTLKYEWELSAQILKETSHMIVFGFAFNAYDRCFLDHLQSNGRDIQQVLVVDVNPNQVQSGARKIWPNAEVESILPPPDGEDRLNKWLKG